MRPAVEHGFKKAFATIVDTHMTTMISALFLLQFGTGPVKGFAVTLIIGLADLHVHGGLRVPHDLRARRTGAASTSTPFRSSRKAETSWSFFVETNIDFLKYKWWAIGASWALISVGLFTVFVQKGLKFGIDFSGGTAIVSAWPSAPTSTRCAPSWTGPASARSASSATRRREKNEVLIRVQQQATEGRDVADDVLRVLRQSLQAETDPNKIDINIEGRRHAGARLAAADPDHVAGKPDVNPEDHYTQAAERVIARRSELGLFRSPADVASVPGSRTPVKAWIQGQHRRGALRPALRRERRPARSARTSRRRPSTAIVWSTIGMLAYIAFRFRSLPFGVGADRGARSTTR